jgi:hypothetical protein
MSSSWWSPLLKPTREFCASLLVGGLLAGAIGIQAVYYLGARCSYSPPRSAGTACATDRTRRRLGRRRDDTHDADAHPVGVVGIE